MTHQFFNPRILKFLNLIICLLVLQPYTDGQLIRRTSGVTAAKNQFPYFAQLRIMVPVNESFYRYAWCSATLINPRWILTAAHCFPNSKQVREHLISSKRIMVLMGTRIKNDIHASKRTIVQIHMHHNYLTIYGEGGGLHPHQYVEEIHNDIALGKLKTPYKLNRSIKIIKLPSVNSPPICKNGTVVGIGTKKGSYSVTYANMSVTPVNELNQIVRPSNTTFYSKVKWTEGHTLVGDSGGPFVCRFGKALVQYGITSNGYPSNDAEGYITEFTDVAKYADFIEKYVKIQIYYGSYKKRINSLSSTPKTRKGIRSNTVGMNCNHMYSMFLLYFNVIKNLNYYRS